MINMGDIHYNQHCLLIHDSVKQQVFSTMLSFFSKHLIGAQEGVLHG